MLKEYRSALKLNLNVEVVSINTFDVVTLAASLVSEMTCYVSSGTLNSTN